MGENLSLRDRAAIFISIMVLLYVGLVACWFFMSNNTWAASRKQYAAAVKKLEKENSLISKRAKWEADYEAEKVKMPMIEEGMPEDTYWLKVIGDIAVTNHIEILNPSWEKEEVYGDVYEFPAKCDWQGSLEALVNFLHAVNTTPGTMMDVRSISVRPVPSHRGYLKGKLSITCAYMRKPKDVVEEKDSKEEEK